MKTVKDLGDAITEKLHAGNKLYQLEFLLQSYNGDDYRQFIEFSDYNYTRNIMYINNVIEIVLICWNIGQQSTIHDHPHNGCLMKMVEGNLIEEVYSKVDSNYRVSSYKYDSTNYLDHGDIRYQENKYIIHKISNSFMNPAISLHIYSPPNYIANDYNVDNQKCCNYI